MGLFNKINIPHISISATLSPDSSLLLLNIFCFFAKLLLHIKEFKDKKDLDEDQQNPADLT
jgi:hypothetical protein